MNIVLAKIIESRIVIVLTLVVLIHFIHKWRSDYKIISLSSD